jgi:RNA polymerase sigma-70 factor (ECF subfamily)
VASARSDATDEALMIRFQRGDRGAFASLVRKHQGSLFNFALRQLRSAGSGPAEDVVQEVFIRVVQNASDFNHEARFTTWVYTIARNLCIDLLRKQALRNHPSLDDARGDGATLGEQTADPQASVERGASTAEIRERLMKALAELPDEQREVFLLREVSSLPFKEIADITGAPENTVKSRMRYALERLQVMLRDYEEYARALR